MKIRNLRASLNSLLIKIDTAAQVVCSWAGKLQYLNSRISIMDDRVKWEPGMHLFCLDDNFLLYAEKVGDAKAWQSATDARVQTNYIILRMMSNNIRSKLR